jgi:hypothetical protein
MSRPRISPEEKAQHKAEWLLRQKREYTSTLGNGQRNCSLQLGESDQQPSPFDDSGYNLLRGNSLGNGGYWRSSRRGCP